MSDSPTAVDAVGQGAQGSVGSSEGLLPQLVKHLRQNRTVLREAWARRITEAELLTAMTPEELFSEATVGAQHHQLRGPRRHPGCGRRS